MQITWNLYYKQLADYSVNKDLCSLFTEWSCNECTFKNSMSTTCEMCFVSKPQPLQPEGTKGAAKNQSTGYATGIVFCIS